MARRVLQFHAPNFEKLFPIVSYTKRSTIHFPFLKFNESVKLVYWRGFPNVPNLFFKYFIYKLKKCFFEADESN